MNRGARRMTVVAAFLLIAGMAQGTASAAPVRYEALSPEYVAIGDSYASGVGTRTYYSDGSGCQRSPRAYPVVASVRVGATLVFEACVGANTADVLADQLDPLDVGTDLVTVMVGGNDAGFSSVITECAKPWWAANCGDRVDVAQDFISGTLPGRLDTVYHPNRAGQTGYANVVDDYLD